MILCLHDIISKGALLHPDNAAIIDQGRFFTYRDLNKNVDDLAAYMICKGVKKGERVGLLARNSAHIIAAYFAISKAGCISVPLNHTLNADDIARQANGCSISSIYVGQGLELKAREVTNKIKSLKFVIKESQGAVICKNKKFPKIKDKDPASIIYTSGSTRKPLGVVLSHKNLISNNTAIAKYTHLGSSDKIICVLPLYYIYGLSLVISHFIAGGTVIIENRFAYPNMALDAIEKYKATGFAGVSSHYIILLNMSDIAKRRLPSLRYFMQAGDRMGPEVTKKIMKLFPRKKVYLMYGQTEASPRITYLDPSKAYKKSASVGNAVPGVKVKILDGRGKECPAGREGELVVKGDNVMFGYWNNRSETKKVLKKGWLYTKDIGFKDKDGDIFLVGREKDFMKIGGNRVNPAQIESVLSGLKGIMEGAVIGVKDPLLGERVKLFITLMPGTKITSGEIMKFCKAKLPAHSIPKEVIILKSMPKNSFGKIDKISLRK